MKKSITIAFLAISISANCQLSKDIAKISKDSTQQRLNDSCSFYRIKNLQSNLETSGTISTNLPANTAFLGRLMWATNNATAAAVAWDCSRFGLETDF
jgi:hypothetical protein